MHDDLDLNLEPSEPSVPDVDQGGVSLPHGEVDHEGAMAKADLYKLANYSLKLFKKIQEGDQLESWVQAKITKAADYIASVYHYLEYEMEFSEYGKKLEDSDVLSEGQKAELKNKLMEARAAIKDLKLAQAEKQFGKVEEGILSGGEETCKECGGTGKVMVPAREVPETLKNKVKAYNRKAKAMSAAVKRVDANKNGIPDDEEVDEARDDEPAEPNPELIAKRKAREAAQRRREEKEEADYDDLSKDIKPKGEKSSGTKKVAGKAYGGSAQKDEKEVDEGQGGVYGQGVYEGKSKKAKKDYDKDGKIESEKDEVIGSRRKAAGLDEATGDYSAKKGTAGKVQEASLNSNFANRIHNAFGAIYDMGDEGLDYLDKHGNIYNQLFNKHNGDLDRIILREKPAVLRRLADELEDIADGASFDLDLGEGSTSKHSAKKGTAGKNFAKNEGQGAPLSPEQAAAVAKSSDPNAYNKAKGIATPKTTTPVVSPDEGPTKNAKPAVVKESAELNRMKEFLTRLNG